MRVVQLALPIEGAPPICEIRELRVRPRFRAPIESLKPTLNGLHIKRSELEDVLGYPEDHHRRVLIGDNSKRRICWSPSPTLRKIQKRVVRYIAPRVKDGRRSGGDLTSFRHHCEQAYWRASSIVRNAREHRRNQSSLVLDLEGAFESVTTRHIERYLRREFRWVDFDGFADFHSWPASKVNAAARLFSRLLTFRGYLRRGPPSSPLVFNLLMRRLDRDLEKALGIVTDDESRLRLERDQIVYTRYGDDLCFSAPTLTFPERAVWAIEKVVSKHGLRLNKRKKTFGRNGVLILPGVVIVTGRIRPAGKYLARLAAARKQGMTDQVLDGHNAFVYQFGHSGELRVLKSLLAV